MMLSMVTNVLAHKNSDKPRKLEALFLDNHIRAGYPKYDLDANITKIAPAPSEILMFKTSSEKSKSLGSINVGKHDYYVVGKKKYIVKYFSYLQDVNLIPHVLQDNGRWTEGSSNNRYLYIIVRNAAVGYDVNSKPSEVITQFVLEKIQNAAVSVAGASLSSAANIIEIFGLEAAKAIGNNFEMLSNAQTAAKRIEIITKLLTNSGFAPSPSRDFVNVGAKGYDVSVAGGKLINKNGKLILQFTSYAPPPNDARMIIRLKNKEDGQEINAEDVSKILSKLNSGGNIDLTGAFNDTMVGFGHADSVLKLQNTDNNADHTITLHNNLAGAADDAGKVQLTSSGAGHRLIIAQNAAETIGTAVNRIRELIVDGGQNTEINPEVFAKNLTLETTGAANFANGLDTGVGGTINVEANTTTLQGDITNTGGGITVNLGQNTLTYNGGTASLVGAVTINTIINPGVGIGNIIVDGAGTTLDLGAATGLIINLNGTSDLGDVGKSYKLLSITNGGTITYSPVAPTFTNNDTSELGVNWRYKDGAIYDLPGDDKLDRLNSNNTNAYVYYAFKNGHIVTVSRLKEGLTEDFGQTNPGIVAALADIDITQDTDARDLANSFGNMSKTNHVRQQEAADRLSVVAPTEAVGSVVTEVVQAAQNSIGIRMNNLSSAAVAVASGDEEYTAGRYGIWGSPFYGQATQKKKGSVPGYKGKSGGGTIGFDCLVNDDLTLGMALTAVNTKINHKNQKAGDTTKVKSKLLSIYGTQQLIDNWFVQAIASYGSSKVRNYEKRIINLTLDQTAFGKYSSTSYSGEILAGYKYMIADNQLTLTPMLGLRYGKFKDGGYTETGTDRRNLTVGKKSVEKLEAVAGGRASFVSQLKDDMLLMPEVHGFINYDLKKAKAPSVDARLNGALASMPVKTAKPERAFYNLGAGLTIKHQMMEYGIDYDAYLAKKYVSNQGSIKVRVNF